MRYHTEPIRKTRSEKGESDHSFQPNAKRGKQMKAQTLNRKRVRNAKRMVTQ